MINTYKAIRRPVRIKRRACSAFVHELGHAQALDDVDGRQHHVQPRRQSARTFSSETTRIRAHAKGSVWIRESCPQSGGLRYVFDFKWYLRHAKQGLRKNVNDWHQHHQGPRCGDRRSRIPLYVWPG